MENVTESRTRLLTATEVAARLGVRPAFVYDLARRHLLPVVHVGRYCRFDPAALDRWLEGGGADESVGEGSTDFSSRFRDRSRKR